MSKQVGKLPQGSQYHVDQNKLGAVVDAIALGVKIYLAMSFDSGCILQHSGQNQFKRTFVLNVTLQTSFVG